MANARAKAEEADIAARDARIASDLARIKAKEFAPEFKQPGSEILKKKGDLVSNAPDYIGTKPIPVANHTQNANRSKQNYYQPPSPSPDKVNARGGHGLINKKDSTLPGGSKTNPTSNKNIESDNPYGHYASDSPKDSPLVTKKQNYSYEKPDNLNDLINSGMLNDHFDQYSAKHREDSGLSLGRESEYDYGGPPHNEPPTPDSVTDTDEIGSYRPNRRKTLPSLQSVNAPKPPEPRVVATVQRTVSAKVPNTASPPPRAYNRENGVRKRVAAEVHGLPTQDSNPHIGMGAKRGSLPDVTQCGQLKQNVASRETMSRLSHQRRQEMIREREEAEKRRKWDVVIRFSDVKDWCQQRQLLMFVIAVNVSLATVFFNLISQQ